jgi:hypothetical protein
VQISVAKGGDLARHGAAVAEFGNYSFDLLNTLLSGPST